MKMSVYKCDLKDITPNLHPADQEAWGTCGTSGGQAAALGSTASLGTPRRALNAGHGCRSPQSGERGGAWETPAFLSAPPVNVSEQQNGRFSGCPG